MDNFIKIGDLIKHYRKLRKLSQEELSEGICTRKYISDLENHRKVPTLFIINELSMRLGVNLYDSYAIMLQHHDMNTHKKIIALNKALSSRDFISLQSLMHKYKDLKEFQSGEPKQLIQYCECVYLSNVLQDTKKAISKAQEALPISGKISSNTYTGKDFFSNLELNLLVFLAVNCCRENMFFEGKKYFDFLYNYLGELFLQNHYIANRNNHFELRLFANIIYNDFCFFYKKGEFSSQKLDNILSLLKNLHSHFLLPELLLCKSCIYYDSGKSDLAVETYNLAYQLGTYLYSKEAIEKIKNRILQKCVKDDFSSLLQPDTLP